jgi:6-phosphogluconolactonase
MSGQKRAVSHWAVRIMAGVQLALLTGCGGFFPPLTSTGTGTTTAGDFVYVANATTNTISAFAVGANASGTGTLTTVSGSPYGFPVSPTAMVVTPSDSYLYVAGPGGIYGYSINTSTGALTAVSSGGVLVITTLAPVSLDVSPDGNWLFALNADGVTFNEYQITPSTGVLTLQASTPYAPAGKATVTPEMIRVAPNGAYVFVALGTGGDLVFTLTTSTGALSTTYQQLATGSTSTSDNALAIDSGTTYAYIARSGTGGGLMVYSIGTNGVLTPVTGSPFATGAGPFSVLLDSTGKYVYTANRTDGNISGFSIGTGAVLTALSSSPYTSGTSVTSLARDKSGSYVLAAASGGSPDLTMYSFDTTTLGKLDSVATTSTGTDPTGAVAVVATK